MDWDHPANVEEYPDAKKIARQLNDRQIKLLFALDRARQNGSGLLGEIALDRADVPSAKGMERRGLISTHRPTVRTFSLRTRYVPGSKRWAHIKPKGRAVLRHLVEPASELLEIEIDRYGMVRVSLDGVTQAKGIMYGRVLVIKDSGNLRSEHWEKVAAKIEGQP